MTTIEQAKDSSAGVTIIGRPPSSTKAASIERRVTDDQICILTFDRRDSSANIFDRETLLELDEHLDQVAGDAQLKGLILASGKKSIFIAGADIKAFTRNVSDAELRGLIELGQAVFNRIEALKIPTVAAIHGACLGGGYEICLACDYRIASSDRSTRIGLPETQLGILPAWGGSTRLPRLIGLPKALALILAGKTLAAKPALRSGMVDELVPREYLLDAALKKLRTRGTVLRYRKRAFPVWLSNTAIAARIIAKRAKASVLKKTRGHYPAVLKALEVVSRGIAKSPAESMRMEADAVLDLAKTPACKNLVQVFFLQERAKKLSIPTEKEDAPLAALKRASVIGAGVMGAGIAQWLSARKLNVILQDINAEQVARGMTAISGLYAQGVKRHAFTQVEARSGMDRIYPATSEVSLANCEIVIEAAVERMELKKKIFSSLEERTGPRAILATNTSALSVSELAADMTHAERVIGIHFFNPVHRMPLVEIVVGRQTDSQTVRRAVGFVQQIGKLPVVVKDSPGFLVNRILMPYLIEAGWLFENGAGVEDIDEAMLDFGMPMGPLRLIDEVGVDVSKHVADTLSAAFQERMETPALLSRMLEAGLLGRKSGKGFYFHRPGKEPVVNPQIDRCRKQNGAASLSRAELQNRMVLLMVNEAARCLEEDIVATAADVDFGMIMGTGFAPFLGGPLRFADYVGVREMTAEMERLGRKEPRFSPCALLEAMASANRKFYEVKGSQS